MTSYNVATPLEDGGNIPIEELDLRVRTYNYALCEFLAHRRARRPSQPSVTEAVPPAG